MTDAKPPRVPYRRAVPGDAAVLTQLAHDAKRHWGYPENWMAEWRDALTISADCIARCHVECAVRDDVPVAFVAVSSSGGTAEIEHLWVAPAVMGQGIGAELFGRAVVAARRAGASEIRIESDPNAVGFYRGWARDRPARCRPYPPDGPFRY